MQKFILNTNLEFLNYKLRAQVETFTYISTWRCLKDLLVEDSSRKKKFVFKVFVREESNAV